ncbi:MAG: hypothetical protein AMJ43_08225 [Coxiella sp. DG_40]|nr:MAG: hypothetical protein AMJ43_08225 [Coxiella sp. DG_40]
MSVSFSEEMNAGICRIKLHLSESQSLKDKRRIVKSIISRLRSQYNISIAEVDDQDLWQLITLGIACVSNQNHHVDETLSKVMSFIAKNYPELEIVDQDVEILSAP